MQKLNSAYKINDWLPTSLKEVRNRGWDVLDVILFTGDAYVDHPAFGAAVISRVLENQGLRVAIVPQPNWRDDLRDFKKLGKPRLFFGVTSGNMDSMVNHYTANLRQRSDDAFTPAGKAGFRPDYATSIYSNILKKLFPNVPLVIGGIEASLRRFTHYDYWSDKLKPSIVMESKADILIYGMGEKPVTELARLLQKGIPVNQLQSIPQTAFLQNTNSNIKPLKNHETIYLFSHEECLNSKSKFAANFINIEQESNRISAKRIIQKSGNKVLVVNPPYLTLSEKEIDRIYDLPFTRLPHPRYNNKAAIPAYEMIKFSINIHRGCFGGCSFCTISAHQGKFIASRSEKSILSEVNKICGMPGFKGYISDLGGPSANMYKMKGENLNICRKCKKPSCIYPTICKILNTDHSPLLSIYKKVRNHPAIKKAFIGSGVRYDLFLSEHEKVSPDKQEYFRELIRFHVSGRLKVAPEHTSNKVLKIMRKPPFSLFLTLKKVFDKENKAAGMNQQLIPYFISSHPASTNIDMAQLAIATKNLNFRLEQAQDFTPTPMTLSAVMYYTGIDPNTKEKIYITRSKEAKLSQRKFLYWYKNEYRQEIKKELEKAGRKDLIGKLF
jgi:uncharacterized radical SAM protein YgiQ